MEQWVRRTVILSEVAAFLSCVPLLGTRRLAVEESLLAVFEEPSL
jgi:hypothetical protein